MERPSLTECAGRRNRELAGEAQSRSYDEEVAESRHLTIALIAFSTALAAQWRTPPAGIRPARAGSSVSILPGGRVIAPLGEQYRTGAEPAALAASASGKSIVTVNLGPERPSLTVLEHDKSWSLRNLPTEVPGYDANTGANAWRTVAAGVAFSGEHSVYVAEGNTGRIALIDLETGERRRSIPIETGGAPSVTGDLALDAARNILYAADLANSRLVAIDTRSRQTVATIALDGVPVAFALTPNRRKIYVITARNLLNAAATARSGVSVVDIADPRSAKVETAIHADGWTDSGLAGIVATENAVFVSDSANDSIAVIDPRTNQVAAQVPIRIPGLDTLRGVLPIGMAFDSDTGWLLVAEAGINAVGVIDTRARNVLGHLGAGWFPTKVLVDRGTVYVANLKGQGTGPDPGGNHGAPGTLSSFPLPKASELPGLTRFVMESAGFTPRPGEAHPLPRGIRHVVLIVKESRSFDEVLGDITKVSNGPVMSAPPLARFGRDGYADGRRQRLSLHHIDVTPNHHAIAARWTFSDNFYAASRTNEEGRDWLTFWRHLAHSGVSFAKFGEPFDREVSDTSRVQRVIDNLQQRADLPQVLMIHLPNDRTAGALPEAGFPYEESYVADNDFALGRLLQYLSQTKWWNQMAVFVTEASAEGGIDHIDAHRTLLLCAGPWARKNRVSHTNAGFPALRKTIFGLLGLPPLDLNDASAADLGDCLTDRPDAAPFQAVSVDPRLYRPEPEALPVDARGRN